MVGCVDVESIWLVCPDFADLFEWCETLQCLQSTCVVIGRNEVGDVCFELRVSIVVVTLDRCLLDRPVHTLDLAVRPGMVHLSLVLVDAMLTANAAEDVCEGRSVLLSIGELDAVIRQNSMDFVGQCCDEIAQELGRDHLACSLVQLDIGELGSAVDGHEQADFTLTCANLRNVDMKIADRVSFELLLGLVTFNFGQAADAMPLQATVQ